MAPPKEVLLPDPKPNGFYEARMSDLLTSKELAMFENAPEDELVDLAIDLDVPIPAEIDRTGLLSACVQNIADLGEREGLPFSDYDRTDLEELDERELNAIAALNGIDSSLDTEKKVALLLKTGKKKYKMWRKQRPKSQIPIYLPMFLAPVARHLVQRKS